MPVFGRWNYALKLLISILIVAAGLAVGWLYLRKPPLRRAPGAAPAADDRPWRRVGAAICILLAVMFVAGIYLLDEDRKPGAYVAYWLVMMALVLWLCLLVVRDLLYTRQVIARWKNELRGGRPGAPPGDPPDEFDS